MTAREGVTYDFWKRQQANTLFTFAKTEVSREEVLGMMAGTEELEEFARSDEEAATEAASNYQASTVAGHALADELHKERDRLKGDSQEEG